MTMVRVKGTVGDGRSMAFWGHRRLYAGDVIELKDGEKVPSWADVVKKVDPEKIVKAGPAREVFKTAPGPDLASGEPTTNREIQAAHRANDRAVL